MPLKLIVAVVVIVMDSRFLDRAVHAFNLAIGPGMLDLGQPVIDIILAANPAEDVRRCIDVPLVIGELNTVVGENRMKPVRQHGGEIAQELRGQHLACFRECQESCARRGFHFRPGTCRQR